MRHEYSPDEVRQRQSGPDADFFEEISTLRDRIARLAESASRRGRELDLHGLLLDVLPTPAWIASIDSKCVFFNRSWLKFTGRTMEQELGDGWTEGVHPDDVGRVMETYLEAVRERKDFAMEYRLRRHDGKYRHVVDLGAPFYDLKGEPGGYIGSVFDITERVEAEEQTRMAVHDLGERVKELTALNGALDIYQQSGTIGELLGRMVSLLPPAYQYPEITAARITYGDQVMSTPGYTDTPWKQSASFVANTDIRGSIEVVYLAERPREDEGPFLTEERTLIDSLAKLTRAFINRRMSADAVVRLASIVEYSNDAIIGKALDGTITTWNPAAEQMYGYSAGEAIGKPISLIIPEDHRDEMQEILNRIRQGQHTEHFETARSTKEGRRIDVSITVSPIKDDSGQIVGASTIARDITEKKRVRKELEEAKAQAELYLDLISHDINNMNQTGIGYLEMALDTLQLDKSQRLLLEKPLEALESSSRLINNVRKLQRLKSGELKSRPINLCAIIKDLAAYYEQIPRADITIQYLPVEECMVMANDLIRDVFINLIDNAIKHSIPDRKLVIGIGLSGMREGNRDFFVVVVEDNGPGIPDALKYRLFRRYQRGETHADGKGLGLYIVRMLVQSYGGRVWVEDRVPGDYTKGSRFVVVLPAVT